MKFDLAKSIAILKRTPVVLEKLLKDLPEEWILSNEGENTWSPYDVLGHLIHGEKTDWISRMKIILGDGDKKFQPFDRFAQFTGSKGKSLDQLLTEFKQLRQQNIHKLQSARFSEKDFRKTGIHPSFGEVTLEQLLATWVSHDLNHISQICRVMALQYRGK